MVLVALWTSSSPRGSVTSNNPPGVKLYPPCLRPLATHSCLPGGTCSLFGVPPLTIVDILIAVAPLYPIALPSSYLPPRLLPTILRCLSMPSSRERGSGRSAAAPAQLGAVVAGAAAAWWSGSAAAVAVAAEAWWRRGGDGAVAVAAWRRELGGGIGSVVGQWAAAVVLARRRWWC